MIMRSQSGVTLIEMLVALSIFSFIITASVVMMRVGLNTQGQLKETSDIVTAFQLSRSLIKSDMSQISNRQVRSERGQKVEASFFGGAYLQGRFQINDDDEKLMLAFVTGGYHNPEQRLARSELQYVEYWLTDNSLVRRGWTHLDKFDETSYAERILFNNISNITIRFLVSDRWSDQWQSRETQITPRALEITFDHPRFGSMRQLFYIESVS